MQSVTKRYKITRKGASDGVASAGEEVNWIRTYQLKKSQQMGVIPQKFIKSWLAQ